MDRHVDGERGGERDGERAGERPDQSLCESSWLMAALGLLALSALCPLGLASGEAADLAAGAIGVRAPFTDGTPLCAVLVRLAVLIPIGELGTRPHLVAAIGGAIALALLGARIRLGPGPGVAIAAAAGVALIGVCRPFLEMASVHPARAVDFGLLVAIVLLLEQGRRDPAGSRVGLALALACGLAAGAGWSIRAAMWPPAMGLTLWALRRGERWPLVAPLVFVAGSGVMLGGVVSADPGAPGTVGAMLHKLVVRSPAVALDASSVRAALVAVTDDVGVIPLLVAAVGWCVRILRARADTLFSTVLWATAIVATLVGADTLLVRVVMIGALTGPVAAGVGFFAQSFGRARVAAVIVLAVVVAVPPAFVGVAGALGAPGRRTAHAVARRLDAAIDLAGASSMMGMGVEKEAARWRRYRRAVGLDAAGGW